jgi:hypothetical protein
MEAIGFFIAVGVFLVVGKIIGPLLGFVAGVWAAWPFFHASDVKKLNFLNPPVKAYEGSCPEVFEQLHQMLRENVYEFGDRWRIITADTQTNRLIADLNYVHEEPGETRVEKMRRFIRLVVQFSDQADGKTAVQFKFEPKAEGDENGCNDLIEKVTKDFETLAGKGELVSEALPQKLPPPPGWLIVATGASVLMAMCGVGR